MVSVTGRIFAIISGFGKDPLCKKGLWYGIKTHMTHCTEKRMEVSIISVLQTEIYHCFLSPKMQTDMISDISAIGLSQSFLSHSRIMALIPFR